MITSFKIENFRCFSQTKATGLGRINLISGQNNAGKTALLEALFLMGTPSTLTIRKLLSYRRITPDFIKETPDRTWNNLFYQQRKDNDICFDFSQSNNSNKIIIKCDEDLDQFIEMALNDENEKNRKYIEFAENLKNSDNCKSTLHIDSYLNNLNVNSSVIISSSTGLAGRGIEYKFIKTNFISVNNKNTGETLVTDFDKATLEGNLSDHLKQAFQLIDDSIEDVKSLNIGSPELYLKRKGEALLPLGLFGDAMNKIAGIILAIINNKNSLLLIDEIENGIHHNNQEKLWNFLFKLCETYNVQLFATSHSYEMIQAFNNVASQQEAIKANYYEMYRSPIHPEKIIIQKISSSVLEDKLNNKEPIRGELE